MRSSPPRRHCHSTLSLAATDSHSLAIYMLILLSLLSYSVKMTVSPMARGDTVRLYDANGFFGAALPEKIGVSSSRAFKHPSSQAPKHSSSLKMIPISPNASCLTTPPSVLPTTPRSWVIGPGQPAGGPSVGHVHQTARKRNPEVGRNPLGLHAKESLGWPPWVSSPAPD